MAKQKEYNGATVTAEFDKLSLSKQIEMYNALGEEIHKKVVAHRTKLAEEDKLFETAQKSLKTD